MLLICSLAICFVTISSLVKLRKTLNSPFNITFLKLSHLWVSFSSSHFLLYPPSYASFCFQIFPSLLLLLCFSLSCISDPSLSFFPPSMWLQPFSHPTSNQPYTAFRWSSDGLQVDFYLSVHEAPFLHLQLPNTTSSPPTPLSTGMKRCRNLILSITAWQHCRQCCALYLFFFLQIYTSNL